MNPAGEDTGLECSVLRCAPATRADLRKERIIDAARTLFAENGFHNTGIAQVARQSGVLVGQIYRDFANKEEIVAAIVERDVEAFLDADILCRAIDAGNAAKVREWIGHFVESKADNDYRLMAEIVAESSRNQRIAAIFHGVHDRLRQSIGRALEMLAPEPHQERRRALLADVILTISGGVFQRRIGQAGRVEPELIAALIRGIDREIDVLTGRS